MFPAGPQSMPPELNAQSFADTPLYRLGGYNTANREHS
jgi:hypothetical protein